MRDGAVWQLARFIPWRPAVQIRLPRLVTFSWHSPPRRPLLLWWGLFFCQFLRYDERKGKVISMKEKPDKLYKYKAINEHIEYLLDILYNKRLYLATVKELNDPMEETGNVYFSYAGSGSYANTHKLSGVHEEMLSKYRVLSLAEEKNNWVMWSHYANCFNGVCFEFVTSGVLKDVRKMCYVKKREELFVESDDALEEILYQKSSGWRYEKEWRISTIGNKPFLDLQAGDLQCLYVGYRVQPNIRRCLKDICYSVGVDFRIAYINPYKDKVEFKTVEQYNTILEQIEG